MVAPPALPYQHLLATPAGQYLTIAIWLLQAPVWALATLALTGYTSLIRKIR